MPDQVAPLPASLSRPPLLTSPPSSSRPQKWRTQAALANALGFSQAFGRLGLAMLTVALVCVAWTTWLIVLALAPNETANTLMGTGSLDDGQFWLIVDADRGIKYAAVVGLAIVDGYYAYIVLKMTVWRRETESWLARAERELAQWQRQPRAASQQHQHPLREIVIQGSRHAVRFWKELTGITGHYRKLWVRLDRAFACSSLCSHAAFLHNVMSPTEERRAENGRPRCSIDPAASDP